MIPLGQRPTYASVQGNIACAWDVVWVRAFPGFWIGFRDR